MHAVLRILVWCGMTDKAYQKAIADAQPAEEDWSDWQTWNMDRFMFLLWWRVFPLTSHSYMNLVGGLLGMRGIVPMGEFLLATFIGMDLIRLLPEVTNF